MEELIKTGDWKGEKHVPYIELLNEFRKGELLQVKVGVGKEIPHPNTTEHHIRWIEVYFLPENEKFPYLLSKVEFGTHGESIQGPNTSTIYSEPWATISFKTDKKGTIFALAYCNIHGLWRNNLEI